MWCVFVCPLMFVVIVARMKPIRSNDDQSKWNSYCSALSERWRFTNLCTHFDTKTSFCSSWCVNRKVMSMCVCVTSLPSFHLVVESHQPLATTPFPFPRSDVYINEEFIIDDSTTTMNNIISVVDAHQLDPNRKRYPRYLRCTRSIKKPHKTQINEYVFLGSPQFAPKCEKGISTKRDLIYVDDDRLCWWRAAKTRPTIFHTDDIVIECVVLCVVDRALAVVGGGVNSGWGRDIRRN